jgi:uncharacterized protein YjbI with pentapeptide repeats
MADTSRASLDAETPVNPYSLLEAVNHSSDTAHTGWIIFLAVMTYFMIAVAGVTHTDLLLQTPVSLPIMQVDIQIAQFFQFAPIVLLLMHLGLISQLTLLARETLEFDHAVRQLEISDQRSHPLRLELNNFFFVQGIAGPHRSAVMSLFLHGMSWLTLVILPVILILYIQVVFLPYHDVTITWTHRLALIVDVILLISIGVFLTRPETSFLQAFVRSSSSHPITFALTTILLAMLVVFSLFFATVPGEKLDRMTQSAFRPAGSAKARPANQQFVSGFVLPFLSSSEDGALFGLFHRNLVVTDTDLIAGKELVPGQASISLRSRDLRFAKLDRSDLRQADFTGADLEGASFTGADLRNARLPCADVTSLLLVEDRTKAKCVNARGGNFVRARLEGANLAGIDLTAAKLSEAKMEGVEMPYALISGADFSSAILDKADLTGGVRGEAATFLIASLQGADLTGAELQRAEFSSAALQAAVLNYANLQGAILQDADLEAAAAHQTKLQGANMTGARIAATDFRGAGVWMTLPPAADPPGLSDFSDLQIRPLAENEQQSVKQVVERVDAGIRDKVSDVLFQLTNTEVVNGWAQSDEGRRWQDMRAPPLPFPTGESPAARLTDYLARTMCKPRWANGAIATGIARRAQAQQFKGDMVSIYDSLKAETCPAAKTVLPKVLKDFSFAADVARSN